MALEEYVVLLILFDFHSRACVLSAMQWIHRAILYCAFCIFALNSNYLALCTH